MWWIHVDQYRLADCEQRAENLILTMAGYFLNGA